jgi:malonyl-CoA O-methyltransferase
LAEPRFPEKPAVRRAFERAAATYDQHAVLQDEVRRRLVDHLEGIRIEPRRILDLGCGTGGGFDLLTSRFTQPEIVALDLAHPMLLRARERAPWLRRLTRRGLPRLVCGDAERLPLASGAFQMIFSNLALQWCRPDLVFPEAARTLESGGLFIFSTFGPDTLRELRAAFAAVDGAEHVNQFIDMHDLGDALVHAGFADPVMEMEVLTLEYASVKDVARDLQAIGARNAMPGRPRGLSGRRRWERVASAYESHRRNGALPATYEVIYGHAWKVPPKKTADGRQVIDFHPRGAP